MRSFFTLSLFILLCFFQKANAQTASPCVGPDITCPANITVNNDPNQCGAVVTYATPTTTGGCQGVSISSSPASGSFFPVGTTTVTATATDGAGNAASCTFTVTVMDVIAPVPDVASLPNITGQCSASIISAPTATDNCLFITGTTSDPTSYSAQGTHIIHWTYSDGNGNTTTQDQTVIVKDDIAPVPDVASLPNITGQCSASIISAPTATDNCLLGSITGTTPDPTSYSAQGTYTIHWTYSDGNGNTTTQDQTVIVKDNIAPVPDVASLPNITGQCSASIISAPTATDNCLLGSITGTTADPTSYSAQGTYIIHWTYSDGNGNTTTQNQTAIIHDVIAPVITCPANITVVGNSSGSASVSFTVTATDNCAGVTVTTVPASGSSFNVGTTKVTATATDASGNASTCTFTITVNSSCQITCPANITVNNKTGYCGAYVYYPAATVTGSCGTGSYSMPSGSLFPIGTTTVTVTSSTGATCSFTVTVKDVQKPVIVCPANITVTAPSNSCSKVVNFTITATDNCPGVTITSVPASGSIFPAGTTTVTATARDASGNITTSTFTVTVKETTPPVITCPANITVNAPSGQCNATVNPGTVTATDNCSAVTITGTRSDNKALNASYPSGVTTITWKAKDASGNSCTCQQKITVKDIQPPVINNVSVSPTVLWPADHSMKTVTVNYTSTDNCSYNSCQLSVTSNEPISGTGSGDLSPDWQLIDGHHVKLRAERKSNGTGRIYTITITCTDQAGNKTIKTATVSVPLNASSTANRSETAEVQEIVTGLTAQVVPNPADQVFNLVVKSGSNEVMEISVFDIAGRVVQRIRTAATNVISFGNNLVQGTYIVELRQGNKKVVMKAIKQ